jgi:NAD(P)-dependent dehydrogenase (short-subunit alcohol dehydrogenase family)
MESLAGRVALVTGGGRGIGRAIALGLARAGADVAVAARDVSEIEAVASEIQALGRRAFFFLLDVLDRGAVAAAPSLVAGALGPVDVLVNNAGVHASAPLRRTSDATWDGVMAVNATAPFLLCRAFVPGMCDRGFGRVVNVASVGGRVGLRYGSAYAASKHALVGLTRSLALEVASRGVTANAVCPDWVETRMMDQAVEAIAEAAGRSPQETLAGILAESPRGRIATPDEVAQVAVMLAGTSAVNGQCILVDGGAVQR